MHQDNSICVKTLLSALHSYLCQDTAMCIELLCLSRHCRSLITISRFHEASFHGVACLHCGETMNHRDVGLCCLLFAWYVSGGRRKFRIAVTRVAVYDGLNVESATAVKTVER